MALPEILNTVEQTGVSKWLRETPSVFGFYFPLTLHGIGMSLVVGANLIVDLRLLGLASSLPLKPLKRLFGVMWFGLALNILTGAFLVLAYPTKEITNPDFYIKLTFMALAVITMWKLNTQVFNDNSLSESAMALRGKVLAKWSLAFWFCAVWAGRMLSETAIWETFGHRAA